MNKLAYIFGFLMMAAVVLIGCQKENLEPVDQEMPSLRRAPVYDTTSDDEPNQGTDSRSGRTRPGDDNDNVNDDDDNEDGDEIQAAIKRQ
jgi:hypothetical protein